MWMCVAAVGVTAGLLGLIAARIMQLQGEPNFNPQGLASRSHTEYVEASGSPKLATRAAVYFFVVAAFTTAIALPTFELVYSGGPTLTAAHSAKATVTVTG